MNRPDRMATLKEKLKLLNEMYARRTRALPGSADAGRQRPAPVRAAVPIPAAEASSGWPQVQPDTAFFRRNQYAGHRLEKHIPCLKQDWTEEKTFFRISRDISRFWHRSRSFTRLWNKHVNPDALEHLTGHPCTPEDLCFLDLETCGLRGAPLFLIGFGFFSEGRFILEQYFARGYEEEPAVINAFWKFWDPSRCLVTFNGKSFDWPFLEDRTYVLGEKPGRFSFHWDLLHTARRHWKQRLPNCRLQTLETFFCRRSREGDVPGSEIPAAYARFQNHPEEPAPMAAAVHHNALDIITLAEMVLILAAGEECIGAW